jgi:adenylate cyclase
MNQRLDPNFTFWVLVRPGVLNRKDASQLHAKVNAIRDWMSSKNLKLKFNIIDFDLYAQPNDAQPADIPHKITGISVNVLREHLYRETTFLAGQLPLWWAAPAGIKAESYAKLTSGVRKTAEKLAQRSGWVIDTQNTRSLQSFVDDKGESISLVDLGFLDDPSQEELVAQSFDQLTKSLFDPFKGSLMMGLSFARFEGVSFSYVCDRLKKAVTSGTYELEHTDTRFIILDVLNHQFKSGRDRYLQRLFKVCVYLSLGVQVSRTRATKREYEIMRSYVAQWGWDKKLIEELDRFAEWPVEKVDMLARALRSFLLDIYRRLSRQVQALKLQIDSTQDIIRRRRLSACFEGMIGKTPRLFTYFLTSTRKEEILSFIERPEASTQARWELHRESDRGQVLNRPLYAGETLAQVAVWSVFNNLFNPHTVARVISARSEYNIVETQALLNKLHKLITYTSPPLLPDETFINPPKVKRLIISVNPTSFQEESTNSYAAHGWDILNYGQQRRSQLTDISVIMQNSWGELFCRRYQGSDAFTQAMKSLYAEAGARLDLDHTPEILGPNDRVQPIVRKRIQEVLGQASKVFTQSDESPNLTRVFAYEVGGQFQVLYKGPDGARMNTARSLRGVIRRCGRMSSFDQELLIDHLSPSLREVRALVTRFQQDENAKIYVGWRQKDRLGYVVVCDERQRLFFQQSSARETRLAVVRVVRRVLPYLRKQVSSARELKSALRIFEFQEGQMVGGRGPVFTEATSQVLGALSKAHMGKDGLWLVGQFDEGRNGIGLKYGQEIFMASRYGSSFVHACVKHIVEREGLRDPEVWTLDGSKVDFGSKYGSTSIGAVQHLRLVAAYQKEITKALNYILQNFAEAQ